MTEFEKINQPVQRPIVSSRDLNLGFDISEEFCSAAWHALNDPIETVIAASGQADYRGIEHESRQVHLTEPLVKVLSHVLIRALQDEFDRTRKSYPDAVHEGNNMERLIAGCINHMHGAVAYKSPAPTVFRN